MSRAIKSSLDALLKRVSAEVEVQSLNARKKRLKELSEIHAKSIRRLEETHREAEQLAEALEKVGIAFWSLRNGEDVGLTHEEQHRIANEWRSKQKRLHEMRDNVVIRMALADDEEKAFMVRYFFDEVAKEFPDLRGTVSKLKVH